MQYIITIGRSEVANVSGFEFASEAWIRAREFAQFVGQTAYITEVETQEVIEWYDPEEEESYEPEDIDSDFGYDPYEGYYTYDC